MKEDFPIKLQLLVESTNGSTMLNALEEVCEQLKKYEFPQIGVTEREFWKITVANTRGILFPLVEYSAAPCKKCGVHFGVQLYFPGGYICEDCNRNARPDRKTL